MSSALNATHTTGDTDMRQTAESTWLSASRRWVAFLIMRRMEMNRETS